MIGVGMGGEGGFTRTVSGSSERIVRRLTDAQGGYVGTISITRPRSTTASGQRKRSPAYSFKRVSAQVLEARTSTRAKSVANGIQRQLGQLYRKLKSGEYDEEEVQRAILHASQVQRACKKKVKHLQMEEDAERRMGEDEELPAEPEDEFEEIEGEEETRQLEQEEFEALLEKLDESGEELTALAEETARFDEELDEMARALTGELSPEDLDELKARHRAEEQRDILRADLKYLKALFDRLQSEKEQAGKGSVPSLSAGSGVTLSLGGADLPVAASDPAPAETGAVFDAEV